MFTDSEFIEAFGRSFDQTKDCIVGMNGDMEAQPSHIDSTIYDPITKNIMVTVLDPIKGLLRVNYIVALGV